MKFIFIILQLFIFSNLTLAQYSEFDVANNKKIAIVFGEEGYKYEPKLFHTFNDASDISDSLTKLGFVVYNYKDANYTTMVSALENWYAKLSQYDVALFYYSGHGLEVNGENYLIPVDGYPQSIVDLNTMAYPASKILSGMESNNAKFNILILDACRTHTTWTKDLNNGLAFMAGKGSFIGYAATPGFSASDGLAKDRNGLYTEALLRNITIPGLTLDQIFNRVNNYVRKKSSGAQIPFKSSSLNSDLCFSIKPNISGKAQVKSSYIQPSSSIFLSPVDEILYCGSGTIDGTLISDARTLNPLRSSIPSRIHSFKITSRFGLLIYILDSASKCLNVIDTREKTAGALLQFPRKPVDFALSADEKKAYVISSDSSGHGTIEILDLKQRKIIKSLESKKTWVSMAFSPDGKLSFVTSIGDSEKQLSVIDLKTDKIIKRINNIGDGRTIGVTPDGKKIFISNGSDTSLNVTTVLDANTFKVLKTLNFRSKIVTFSADNKYTFAVSDLEIIKIDNQSSSVIMSRKLSSIANGLAISDDGRAFAWLPEEHRIFVFPAD